MPSLPVNTSVSVSLPAGSSINITGNGAWAFIATVSGREIASGSYVGPDVIGPFTRAAVVGLTATVSDGLQYTVQDFAEGNAAAAALTTEQVTALQSVVSGYGISLPFTLTWDTTASKDLGTYTAAANLAFVSTDTGSIVGGSTFAAVVPAGFAATFDGQTLGGWSTSETNIVGLYRVGNSVVWTVNGTQFVRTIPTPAAPVNTVPTSITANAGSAVTWSGGSASGYPSPTIVYSWRTSGGALIQNNITSGSYTPPAVGSFILRMVSTNSEGTDTDDVAVTVAEAGLTLVGTAMDATGVTNASVSGDSSDGYTIAFSVEGFANSTPVQAGNQRIITSFIRDSGMFLATFKLDEFNFNVEISAGGVPKIWDSNDDVTLALLPASTATAGKWFRGANWSTGLNAAIGTAGDVVRLSGIVVSGLARLYASTDNGATWLHVATKFSTAATNTYGASMTCFAGGSTGMFSRSAS